MKVADTYIYGLLRSDYFTVSTENKIGLVLGSVRGGNLSVSLVHWSSANAWKTRFYFADGQVF